MIAVLIGIYRMERSAKCISLIAVVLSFGSEVRAQSATEFYGEMNVGVLVLNDGAQTDDFVVDNTTIPSRLGLRYLIPDTGIGSFRFNLETGLPTDSKSFRVNQQFTGAFVDADFQRTDLRLFQVEWDTPTAGRITVGQGWMSTFLNGASDLSGTNNIAGSNMPINNGGGRLIRTKDGALTGIRFSDGIGRLFGSRRFRVRYDSPDLGGLTISSSVGREILVDDDDQTYADFALRYGSSGLFSGFDVKADIGYSHASDSADYVNGSVAVLHRQTGLNALLASGGYDDGSVYVNGKVGVLRDFWGYGADHKTAVAIQYFEGSDFSTDGSKIAYISFSVVQYLGATLQVYATHALQRYSDPQDSYQNGTSTFIGARYQF